VEGLGEPSTRGLAGCVEVGSKEGRRGLPARRRGEESEPQKPSKNEENRHQAPGEGASQEGAALGKKAEGKKKKEGAGFKDAPKKTGGNTTPKPASKSLERQT